MMALLAVVRCVGMPVYVCSLLLLLLRIDRRIPARPARESPQ